MTDLRDLVRPDVYPRSSTYDPAWVVSLDMGPHPLWLLEDLSADLNLRPGMRVLDLGSGMGATSVFLAREFGVDVVAADLWISPDRARQTFVRAGVDDRVRAVATEAHSLPFAPGDFDAIVSVDAYQYFGTDDMYLAYLTRFLRPGGQLAIAVPAMNREMRDIGEVPPHIRACVGWEAIVWHTVDWWRFQWEITGLVTVTSARAKRDAWADWLLWTRACRDNGGSAPGGIDSVIDMLENDGGEYLSFALVSAHTPDGAVGDDHFTVADAPSEKGGRSRP